MYEPETLLTVGEIARRLEKPLHRVEYVIRTRNLRPTGWAGHARVFHDFDLKWIASELARIDQERGESEADGPLTEDSTHGA